MEWVETTASTIADAKEVALVHLGVHEDDAEFEILAEPRTGLFGRMKEEARVRARVRPTAPRAKDDRRRRRGKPASGRRPKNQGRREGGNRKGNRADQAKKSQPVGKQAGPRARKDRSDRQEKKVNDMEPTMPLAEQADIAQEFVVGLAERFGATVDFVREDVGDDEIHLTVTGDDLGRMVGQRGNTAIAIDELVRTVLQRQAGRSRDGRVRVDVGGVRARRTAALAEFCRSQAAAVRESGMARALEPMSGADRKVVHDTIGDEEGVDTTSEGEDPNRRVVIVPAGDS